MPRPPSYALQSSSKDVLQQSDEPQKMESWNLYLQKCFLKDNYLEIVNILNLRYTDEGNAHIHRESCSHHLSIVQCLPTSITLQCFPSVFNHTKIIYQMLFVKCKGQIQFLFYGNQSMVENKIKYLHNDISDLFIK